MRRYLRSRRRRRRLMNQSFNDYLAAKVAKLDSIAAPFLWLI